MDQVKQAQKRTFQYWYSDGLNEIGFGALMLLLGVYFFLEGSVAPGHPLRFILESGFVIVIVGGSVLVNKLVLAGKERITYRRTGFIDYPRRRSRAWTRALLGVFIGGTIAALATYLTFSNVDVDRWLPAFFGIIVAAVFLYIGLRANVLRFLLLSLVSLAIGGGILLSGLSGSLGYGAFYLLAGLSVSLSGVAGLAHYLRMHPNEVGESDEP